MFDAGTAAEVTAPSPLKVAKPKREKHFTTGQVAKICHVAPRTVSKWFDSGRLTGYRIPGSMDRRVPKTDLLEFMRKNNLPMSEIESESEFRVLCYGVDSAFTDLFSKLVCEQDAEVRFLVPDSAFDAGAMATSASPSLFILGFSHGKSDAVWIASKIRADETKATVRLVGIASEDDVNTEELRSVFDLVWKVPMNLTIPVQSVLDLAEWKLRRGRVPLSSVSKLWKDR